VDGVFNVEFDGMFGDVQDVGNFLSGFSV